MNIQGSINFCSEKFGDGDLVHTMDFSKEQEWQVPVGSKFKSVILFPETYPLLISVMGEQFGEQKEFVTILVRNKNLSPLVVERLDKSFETNEIVVMANEEVTAEGNITAVKVEEVSDARQ